MKFELKLREETEPTEQPTPVVVWLQKENDGSISLIMDNKLIYGEPSPLLKITSEGKVRLMAYGHEVETCSFMKYETIGNFTYAVVEREYC
jgi:hypothetical protein